MANVAPNTVTAVGMAFISAMQITRSMSEPFSLNGLDDRRLGHLAVLGLLLERRGLVDAAPDDVAGDDHDHGQQERDAPSPRLERVGRHHGRQRQEDGGRDDLTGLHALQREAAEVAAATERRVFQDHRAGPGYLAADREALDQAQEHQQGGREDADRVVGGQQRDQERRAAHQEHAQHEHVLAAVRVTPVPEDERADRSGDVADPERREGRDDRDLRVVRREEDVGEDQRGGLGVDEEVVVLERTADPATRRGLLRLLRVLRGSPEPGGSTISSGICPPRRRLCV